MKKVMMIAAIAAALVSCQSKGNQNNNTMDEGVMTVAGNDSSAVAVYEGILPAADGPGIQYVLSVDSVGPNGESGYTLVTTIWMRKDREKTPPSPPKENVRLFRKTLTIIRKPPIS